jgi:hypothetical protein
MTVESESFRAAQEKAGDLTRKAIGTAGGTIVDGNGARPVDDQGPSFDLRSVGAERVGT